MTDANTPDVIVRPYEPRDRDAVRRIACDTANAGKPIETFFNDRELAADLLTTYYTDFEPEAAWVADQNGRVAGYLTGCRDTGRFMRCMAWRVAPRALNRAIARGTMGDPAFWRLVRRNMGIWLRGLFQRRVPLKAYPGHLHLNLDPAFRGQQIGRRLAERCLKQFVAWHVRGIHANVRENNARALRFFERLGFIRIDRHPFLRTEDSLLYSIVLGKKLTPDVRAKLTAS